MGSKVSLGLHFPGFRPAQTNQSLHPNPSHQRAGVGQRACSRARDTGGPQPGPPPEKGRGHQAEDQRPTPKLREDPGASLPSPRVPTRSQVRHCTRLRMEPSKMSEMTLR